MHVCLMRVSRVLFVCVQVMTSEEAYRLAQEKRPAPVEVSVAEDIIAELEAHLSSLSPSVGVSGDS